MVGGAVDERLRKRFFKSWTCIRGGFFAEKHEQLITDISKEIDDLCKFTKGAIELEDVNREQSMKATSNYWLDIRSHTHRLYSALCSIWPKGCASHSHRAKLRLDLAKGDKGDREAPQFNVSFSLSDDAACLQSSSWTWRCVTVHSFQRLHPP